MEESLTQSQIEKFCLYACKVEPKNNPPFFHDVLYCSKYCDAFGKSQLCVGSKVFALDSMRIGVVLDFEEVFYCPLKD